MEEKWQVYTRKQHKKRNPKYTKQDKPIYPEKFAWTCDEDHGDHFYQVVEEGDRKGMIKCFQIHNRWLCITCAGYHQQGYTCGNCHINNLCRCQVGTIYDRINKKAICDKCETRK